MAVITTHSKVRYSQRIGYRENMDKNIKKALKYGVRSSDIPKEHNGLRLFLKRSKIYYSGNVFVFKCNYTILVTVYPYESSILEAIQIEKERILKKSTEKKSSL